MPAAQQLLNDGCGACAPALVLPRRCYAVLAGSPGGPHWPQRWQGVGAGHCLRSGHLPAGLTSPRGPASPPPRWRLGHAAVAARPGLSHHPPNPSAARGPQRPRLTEPHGYSTPHNDSQPNGRDGAPGRAGKASPAPLRGARGAPGRRPIRACPTYPHGCSKPASIPTANLMTQPAPPSSPPPAGPPICFLRSFGLLTRSQPFITSQPVPNVRGRPVGAPAFPAHLHTAVLVHPILRPSALEKKALLLSPRPAFLTCSPPQFLLALLAPRRTVSSPCVSRVFLQPRGAGRHGSPPTNQ